MPESPAEHTATVIHTEYISPKVIWLKLAPHAPVLFTAGQYASFIIGEQQRLYSFANNHDAPCLEFAIDISPGGIGSNYVKNLKINDRVVFLAPFGRFVLNRDLSLPLLFIATGTGIAPVRALIQNELTSNKAKRPLTLIFGNVNTNYSLFHREFTNMQEKNENFSYISVYSNPTPTCQGYAGLVTEFIAKQIPSLYDYDSYICGNSPMVLSTMAILRQNNVPDKQIHLESFT